ncbi:MAG: hypothetical protein H6907_03465 [Hyphomicrobiales bacterium]|nr:hypothetical protein [Hyphomicrobiales bacterium]
MTKAFLLVRGPLAAAGAALFLGLAAPALPAAAAELPAAAARADGAGLQPGLAVAYVYDFVRHLSQLGGWKQAEAGPPLPQLDYRSGEGEVLTSGENNGVGANIQGFIHFDRPGAWLLKVTANDGVRLTVAGQQLYEDPTVHGDRDSEPLPVSVAKAGWYPLEMLYFERKGTATLRLWWSPPGGGEFQIVPAAALGHTGG